jgi:hypothetical protein
VPVAASRSEGKVTAHELATSGLADWPMAVAVYWHTTQRTLCRAHVEHPLVRCLFSVLADEEDIGRVLLPHQATAHRARRWCALCKDDDVTVGTLSTIVEMRAGERHE